MSATVPTKLDRFDKATPWHLRDNNAPITQELTVTDLEVTGAIPTDLNGKFFRNGANPQTGWSLHWFIGDGMIHGLDLSDGKANWYRNRYVRTPMFDNPGADRTELALDLETFTFDLSVSAANTHVIGHGGKILALEEGAFPYELDGELDTVGPFTYDGKLTTAMTAHPKICPETGELLFFGMDYAAEPHFTYYRANAAGELVQSTQIDVRGPSMSHDFAVSRNHIIAMDLPVLFNLELAMQGGMPFRWDPDYGAKMGVLPREGTADQIQWFEVEDCFVFHTLNAFDDGDEVVVRGCRTPKMWEGDSDIAMDGEPNPEDSPRLYEWRLNRATGGVSEALLDDMPSEFPRVADADAGFDGRYGYTMAIAENGAGELNKYDFVDGATKSSHHFPIGHTPGEPVFAPAEGATNGDDGYLMTFVHAADTDTSYLAILDASNMAADPLATIAIPQRVPTGFHGSWIPRG